MLFNQTPNLMVGSTIFGVNFEDIQYNGGAFNLSILHL